MTPCYKPSELIKLRHNLDFKVLSKQVARKIEQQAWEQAKTRMENDRKKEKINENGKTKGHEIQF